MANGQVGFFNHTDGYGFIDTEGADEDVFFHMEDVGGPDLEGEQDEDFDIEQAPQGPARDQRRPQLTPSFSRRFPQLTPSFSRRFGGE